MTFHIVATTVFLVLDMRNPHAPIIENSSIEFDFTELQEEEELALDQYFTDEEMEELMGDREKMNFKDLMQKYDQRKQPMQASKELEHQIMEDVKREVEQERMLLPQDQPQIEEYKRKRIEPKEQPTEKSSGDAFVSYSVKGRRAIYKPSIPAFLCKSKGDVVVKVRVNSSGKVTLATISQQGTTTRRSCNLREAKQAAMNFKFNSTSGVGLTSGTITFRFTSQ